MPVSSLEALIRVVESSELKDEVGHEVAYGCECCNPSDYGEPACTYQS